MTHGLDSMRRSPEAEVGHTSGGRSSTKRTGSQAFIRRKAVCPNVAISTEKTNFAATVLHQSYFMVGMRLTSQLVQDTDFLLLTMPFPTLVLPAFSIVHKEGDTGGGSRGNNISLQLPDLTLCSSMSDL